MLQTSACDMIIHQLLKLTMFLKTLKHALLEKVDNIDTTASVIARIICKHLLWQRACAWA